jgi:predicted glycoside hydrolase/deacetylase ChbG (UPF0249 family)
MKVIVHADDLGISRGITDRIIETHRSGAVQRTSIVANGEAFDYAVGRLRENPGLAWSVHLNLVEGRCLAAEQGLPLLTDRRGWFKRDFLGLLLLPILAPWCRGGLRRQIRSELNAQIGRVRRTLEPDKIRIDSHRYVHLLPFVFPIVIQQAGAWRVREIRVVNEPLFTGRGGLRGLTELMSPNLLKCLILRALSRSCRRQLRRQGIVCPERSLGVLFSGRMTDRIVDRGLKRIARNPPAEDAEVEVLFHPGPADPQDRVVWKGNPRQSRFYIAPHRAAETTALLSPELRRCVELYSVDSGCIESGRIESEKL